MSVSQCSEAATIITMTRTNTQVHIVTLKKIEGCAWVVGTFQVIHNFNRHSPKPEKQILRSQGGLIVVDFLINYFPICNACIEGGNIVLSTKRSRHSLILESTLWYTAGLYWYSMSQRLVWSEEQLRNKIRFFASLARALYNIHLPSNPWTLIEHSFWEQPPHALFQTLHTFSLSSAARIIPILMSIFWRISSDHIYVHFGLSDSRSDSVLLTYNHISTLTLADNVP